MSAQEIQRNTGNPLGGGSWPPTGLPRGIGRADGGGGWARSTVDAG